jgi:hypothetical protein
MGHSILQIVKGVQKVPGDTLSAEVGLDSIDLLDTNGFSTDMYEIKIPALKSSAIYADSPLTDGRTLISGTLGNVSETIRVTLTASTILQLAAMLSKLLRFKQDCNDFWDTFNQIEPVYIKHQIDGEPGPRFALLYDIDIAIETPTNPSEPTRDITLVIERETYWRGIAPGDNPKHWFYIANNQDQQWNSTNTDLLEGSDHRFTGSIVNRAEQNAGGTAFISQNYIEIPAASIPGDAPALVNLSVQQAVSVAATTIMVSKSTKKTTGNRSRSTGNEQLTVYTYNAGDAAVGTDTTLAADTGAPQAKSGSRLRSVTTFVTPTTAIRLSFPAAVSNGIAYSVARGRYVAFLRARVSAAATVNMQLMFNTSGVGEITGPTAVLTDLGTGGTGNSTDWALVYMGVLTIPPDARTGVSANGKGTYIHEGEAIGQFRLNLLADRTSGAGSLYVSDLILMPTDEGAVKLNAGSNMGSSAAVPLAWMYDNTGYFTHGIPEAFGTAAGYVVASGQTSIANLFEISGSDLYLTPGILNRLTFLASVDSTKRSYAFDPSASTVRVNIVPRWSSYRTE